MNSEPIRVAHIMGKMVSGGVESVVMNYYRHIDKNKVQFDFIVDEDSTYIPRDEIESLGGRVIIVPPYQKITSYIKVLKDIFKEKEYRIVHSHLNALSIIPLYAAKKSNVEVRIAHSHSTSNKKEWKKDIIKSILKPLSKIYATHYFCCSELAGRWLFGDKVYNENKVKLINNAIDIEKFIYNENVRKKVRRELNLNNKFVIGHVGRFVEQKNHTKLIDIFYEIYKENKDAVLLLVGDGPLIQEVREKVSNLGITNSVKFIGVRNDIHRLMQGMDLFLFPSLYEGLGLVLIEAQAAGLKCVASSEVPKCAKITDLLEFIPLNNNSKEWCDKLLKYSQRIERNSDMNALNNSGYNIKEESKKLCEIYIKYYI